MIEIKFRTWQCEDNDGFAYFDLTDDGAKELVLIQLAGGPFEQYTGLKDKNGREIYEGDVLEWKLGDFINRMVVRWNQDECCFELHFFKGHFGDSLLTKDDANSDYEVIGNIHENPELLEKGEK